MRFVLASLAFAFWLATANAQLYRWIDPESGSVRISSYPPPWYGTTGRGIPKVEVLRFEAPAAPAVPQGAKPGAAPGAERPPAAGLIEKLDAMRKDFAGRLRQIPSAGDFERGGEGVRQQLEAYREVAKELDRLDPAGAARRRAEESGWMERLRKGIEAQFRPEPPVTDR
jgi:hypothetical protein